RQAAALRGDENLGLVPLHDRDDAVGRSQVDANDLAHDCSFKGPPPKATPRGGSAWRVQSLSEFRTHFGTLQWQKLCHRCHAVHTAQVTSVTRVESATEESVRSRRSCQIGSRIKTAASLAKWAAKSRERLTAQNLREERASVTVRQKCENLFSFWVDEVRW